MSKGAISVEIDSEAKKILEKRAKKEFMTVRELVSDIIRRSCLSYKGETAEDKVDDKFLTYFSRKSKKAKR